MSDNKAPTQAKRKKLDWAASDAKQLMAQDMMDGLVPVYTEIKDKENLYNDMYLGRPEFEDWPWHAENFYSHIRSLQQTVARMKEVKVRDQETLLHDRKLHPLGATHYPDGRPLWKGSQAAECLLEDFNNNNHLNRTIKELKAARPGVYDESSEARISHQLDYLFQNTKQQFGQTPGQAKASKCSKLIHYKADMSCKDDMEPFVDRKPARKPRKKAAPTTKKK